MLSFILLSLLVASAAGIPRSRGAPLHRSIPAQSGGTYQYSQQATGFQNVVVPNPRAGTLLNQPPQSPGATFQVDPQTLQVTNVVRQQPLSQSPGVTFQVDPVTLQATRVVQQDVNTRVVPQVDNPQLNQFSPQNYVQNPSSQQTFQNQPVSQVSPTNQPFPNQLGVQALPNSQTFQNQPVSQVSPTNQPFPNQLGVQALPNSQTFQNQPNNPIPSQAAPANVQFVQQPVQSQPGPTVVRSPTLINLPGANDFVKSLLHTPPGGALLVGTNPPFFPLKDRLISNYTKLRPFVSDSFRCSEQSVQNYAGYGYYADVSNDCQLFHLCLPWRQLFPGVFNQDVTYQFSFICPNQTVFSQDSMTCAWKSEALPCEASPQLYWLNQNFFRKVQREDGFGTRYATVGEKLTPPLVYDYDDFNNQATAP